MKRRRRIEVRIEHREISVFSSQHGPAGDQAGKGAESSIVGNSAAPATCPSCGSNQLLSLTEVIVSPGLDIVSLQNGVNRGIFHLHRNSAGEWLICRESLENQALG